jgi:hypothetical protein
VVGKAVMLDEIINYVQSLQRQVEVYAHSHPTHMQLQNHHETASFAVLERPEEDHLKRLPLMYIFFAVSVHEAGDGESPAGLQQFAQPPC